MPCYNAEEYVERAIRSVLQQSYANFELIIIDDGSTDKSLAVIRKNTADDHRIKLITAKNSGKPSVARNVGIKIASGDILCFLDSDDLYHPDRLQKVADVLHNNVDFDYVFHDCSFVDKDGSCYLKSYIHQDIDIDNYSALFVTRENKCLQVNSGLLQFFLTKRCLVHTSSICIRRNRFPVDELFFREDMTCAEDLMLWCHIVERGHGGYIDYSLSCYRNTPGSITKNRSVLDYDSYRFYCYMLTDPLVALDDTTRKIVQQKAMNDLLSAAYNFSITKNKCQAMSFYWQAMKEQPSWRIVFQAAKVLVQFFRQLAA